MFNHFHPSIHSKKHMFIEYLLSGRHWQVISGEEDIESSNFHRAYLVGGREKKEPDKK